MYLCTYVSMYLENIYQQKFKVADTLLKSCKKIQSIIVTYDEVNANEYGKRFDEQVENLEAARDMQKADIKPAEFMFIPGTHFESLLF